MTLDPVDLRCDLPINLCQAQQLWQAVLLDCWRAALQLVKDKTDEFEAAECRRWFGPPDFFTVCMFAGVDGDAMLAHYRAARARLDARQAPPRARRGKARPLIERIAA